MVSYLARKSIIEGQMMGCEKLHRGAERDRDIGQASREAGKKTRRIQSREHVLASVVPEFVL